jgi:cyclopropane-fatty-acyl-phospholipid synthase
MGDPRLLARVESWVDHEPDEPYDAIVSIEAIEAFTRLDLPSEDKVRVYRAFFERCRGLLRPSGRLSLQAIVFGDAGPEDLDGFIAEEIFPESNIARLRELCEGWERLFEIVRLRNDRLHYADTLRAWRRRLSGRRADAALLVGDGAVVRYLRYLRLCEHIFRAGACDLVRVTLEAPGRTTRWGSRPRASVDRFRDSAAAGPSNEGDPIP